MHWYDHRLSSAGNTHILNTLLACHLTGCHIHALLHGNICLSITCSCSKPDVNILSFIIGLRTLLTINVNRMEYWIIFRISTDYSILLLTTVRFTHSLRYSQKIPMHTQLFGTWYIYIYTYIVHLRSSFQTIKNEYTVSTGKIVVIDIKMII